MTIAGNLQLTFETAPADQESLFKAIDTITLTAASSTPIVRKIYMNAADGVSTPTLARFLRWKLSSPGGGTWDATFRIHVSVSESVRDAFLPLNLPNLLLWLRADLGLTTA